jgi:3-hydroxybutyrate dehydrogenase
MLSGRTALVTGSTSGIGLTIAQSLAAAGANIVIWLRRCQSHRGGEVQACPRLECRCGLQPADMTHPADIEAMMTLAAKEFGHVDILVNDAGIQHVDPIEDFPTAKWGRHHRHHAHGSVPYDAPRRTGDEEEVGAHH